MSFVQLCRQYAPYPSPCAKNKQKTEKEKKKKQKRKKKEKREKKRKGKKSLVLSGAGRWLGATDCRDLQTKKVRRMKETRNRN